MLHYTDTTEEQHIKWWLLKPLIVSVEPRGHKLLVFVP